MTAIFLILALLGYYLIHSALATSKVKASLGAFIPAAYYRLFYNVVAILLLLPLLWLYWAINKKVIFASSFLSNSFGILLLLGGGLLMLLSLRQYNLQEFLGTQYLKSKDRVPPSVLNTSGLNGIVRHPLYLAALMILWGFFIFRPNSANLIIASVTNLYLFIGIYWEEKKLIIEFGEGYKKYQREVKMLIPFLI